MLRLDAVALRERAELLRHELRAARIARLEAKELYNPQGHTRIYLVGATLPWPRAAVKQG